MPKVVSRFTVSSSEQNKSKTKSSKAVLRSYYCLCGDFLLVIQGKLDRLPRRKSDGSYIVRSRDTPTVPARKFKLNAPAGDRHLIQRKDSDKMEIRQPFVCGRCGVTVAYQITPRPISTGPFLYILKGAMTEEQGKVPEDAFEGEEDVFDEDDLANELFEPINPDNLPDHMKAQLAGNAPGEDHGEPSEQTAEVPVDALGTAVDGTEELKVTAQESGKASSGDTRQT